MNSRSWLLAMILMGATAAILSGNIYARMLGVFGSVSCSFVLGAKLKRDAMEEKQEERP